MDESAIREFIAASSWFDGAPNDVLDKLADAAKVKQFHANSYLWSMGETNAEIFGVLSGRVRVSVSSTTGQEFVFVDQEPPSKPLARWRRSTFCRYARRWIPTSLPSMV